MSTYSGTANRNRGGAIRRTAGRALSLILLGSLVAGAAGFIGYVLWPRWPVPPGASDAPPLPVTIAGVVFNVPAAAIRVPVQRRSGAHERIDLAFVWPSLLPPDPAAKPVPLPKEPAELLQATGKVDRVFMTILAGGETLPPAERIKSIYARHVEATPVAGPPGLAVLAFRDGTPYQGEDLIYDEAAAGIFLVRCSRSAGPTPGICLYEHRIDAADLVVRFPRDWLDDWQAVAANIEKLIKSLQPRS